MTEQYKNINISKSSIPLPQEQNVAISARYDGINLRELLYVFWSEKITIILVSFLFTAVSMYYAINQPNIYKASVLLSPSSSHKNDGGLASIAGQFGGLANLAGINLGSGTIDKTVIALEVLKSRSFIEKFISNHDLTAPLMAVKSWNSEINQLVFNGDIYDDVNNQWLIKETSPPSLWQTYKVFSNLLLISQDSNTGMITISLEYYSPYLAREWLTLLVKDINSFIKEKEYKEAQKSIAYLTDKLDEINISAMENVFYQLIEEQTKNMMLTQVKDEYVLKTIEPAQFPEEKARPKRALIVVLGTMLGGIFSVLIVLIRFFLTDKKVRGTEPNLENGRS